MRQINYRAWDEDLKKYFYLEKGHFLIGGHGACGFCSDWIDELIKGGFVEKGYHKTKVLEQSTGKIDIHNEEIYSGHILRFTYDCLIETHILTGYVEWNDDGYWEIQMIDEGISLALFDDRIHEIEIIGNVHQNPDLLEGKE